MEKRDRQRIAEMENGHFAVRNGPVLWIEWRCMEVVEKQRVE